MKQAQEFWRKPAGRSYRLTRAFLCSRSPGPLTDGGDRRHAYFLSFVYVSKRTCSLNLTHANRTTKVYYILLCNNDTTILLYSRRIRGSSNGVQSRNRPHVIKVNNNKDKYYYYYYYFNIITIEHTHIIKYKKNSNNNKK